MKKNKYKFMASAIVLHRNHIKSNKYKFKVPFNSNRISTLEIGLCSGIDVKIISGEKIIRKRKIVDDKEMLLTTYYCVKCNIDIDSKLQIFYSKTNQRDWSRSSEGRRFYEDIFIKNVNYFFENLIYFSDKKNPSHHLFSSIRPIGSEDIVEIEFYINDRCVAAQANSVFSLLSLKEEEDRVWPATAHVTRKFRCIPTESNLLWRASTLINFGFYQEAILISFSVIDSKLQDLIKARMKKELNFNNNQTDKYLRNISQGRIETLLVFILKCLDNTSIRDTNSNLYESFKIINNKRNKIMHEGEYASRDEAIDAVMTSSKILNNLNKWHKSDFDIPKYLLDDSKSSFWWK